jgi:hypothetical protein
MRRSAVLLVMLMAMLWQSVALARMGPAISVLVDREHAALHWLEEGHHHHEDGSLHRDDSAESAQHMVADHPSAALAMAAPASHDFRPLGSAAPAGRHATAGPDPTLSGLLRPPRCRA